MAWIFTEGSFEGIQNGRPERVEQGLGVYRLVPPTNAKGVIKVALFHNSQLELQIFLAPEQKEKSFFYRMALVLDHMM